MGARVTAFVEQVRLTATQTNERSRQEKVKAHSQKFARVSDQLKRIALRLKGDIMCEARGQTDPFGRSVGYVEYALKDDRGNLADFSPPELEEIGTAAAYGSLATVCTSLGLQVRLEKRESSASRHHASASGYNCYVVVSGWGE